MSAKPEKQGVPPEYLAEPRRYFLEWIPDLLRQHAKAHGHFGKADTVAQFHLTGEEGGWWHFVLTKDTVAVAEGVHPTPGFTLTMDVDVWRRLNKGEANGFAAWLKGDVKITGSKLKFLRVARLFG
jgi:putative sterol carrier protein